MNTTPRQICSIDRAGFRWWRRTQMLLTIGGGFLGLVMIVQSASTADRITLPSFAVVALLGLLYGYGVFVGWRYSEHPENWGSLLLYHLVQIPMVTSPVFSFIFTSGFAISVQFAGGRLGFGCNVGSTSVLSFGEMQAWSAGMNIFAAVMALALIYTHSARRTCEREEIAPLDTAREDPY